ncbi:MaoC/PaaZ C-terminal domain-containing protein [Halorientalis sp.]|uniref:MaoC/PaaZ C-terminal domain-containing protein n=1 Tax=Halorientalis sp. TaxID=1931229 RepID=UPI00260EE07C|nr:MaoC/PaaZ C-terminal domain-containing protein [Halorientalis sp.]
MPPATDGRTHTVERTVSESDVREFADLSNDRQDRHLDPGADGRLMIHGLLTATLPAKVGGDPGVLASRMAFSLRRPVYTGQQVHCAVTFTGVTEGRDRDEARADIECAVDGETVLSGSFEGVVLR